MQINNHSLFVNDLRENRVYSATQNRYLTRKLQNVYPVQFITEWSALLLRIVFLINVLSDSIVKPWKINQTINSNKLF